jgi:nicotinamidase-related amidase
VEKATYSCVTPEFVALLRAQNVSEIHVCSIDTDQCVMMIAASLLEHNLRPIVCENVIASVAGADYHRCGLFVLRRLIDNEQGIARD